MRATDVQHTLLSCVSPLTICALLLGASLPSAAERQWNTGTWAATADAQFLAIETAHAAAHGGRAGGWRGADTDGHTRHQRAIRHRKPDAVRARRREGRARVEARRAWRRSTPAATPRRAAATTSETVAPGGISLTLEDGSRWDIEPRSHFSVAEWQPDDLISVRRSNDDEAYAYEIDNTSRDSGVLANHRVR